MSVLGGDEQASALPSKARAKPRAKRCVMTNPQILSTPPAYPPPPHFTPMGHRKGHALLARPRLSTQTDHSHRTVTARSASFVMHSHKQITKPVLLLHVYKTERVDLLLSVNGALDDIFCPLAKAQAKLTLCQRMTLLYIWLQ